MRRVAPAFGHEAHQLIFCLGRRGLQLLSGLAEREAIAHFLCAVEHLERASLGQASLLVELVVGAPLLLLESGGPILKVLL